MKWNFPEGPCSLEVKDGTFHQVEVVAEDDETVTFDFTLVNSGGRMRTQILRESIVAISYPTPTVEALQAMMNRGAA